MIIISNGAIMTSRKKFTVYRLQNIPPIQQDRSGRAFSGSTWVLPDGLT